MSTTLVEVFLNKADTEASALYARSERLQSLAKIMRQESMDVSADDLDRLAGVYARIAHDLREVVKNMTSAPTREPT